MTEPQLNLPLKPCPFCKAQGDYIETRHHTAIQNMPWSNKWWLECTECHSTCGFHNSEQEAINAWNARPVEAQLLEACKAALEWAAQYPLGIASCEPDRDAARDVYHKCRSAIAAAEGAP